jgi:hypothetical protein
MASSREAAHKVAAPGRGVSWKVASTCEACTSVTVRSVMAAQGTALEDLQGWNRDSFIEKGRRARMPDRAGPTGRVITEAGHPARPAPASGVRVRLGTS